MESAVDIMLQLLKLLNDFAICIDIMQFFACVHGKFTRFNLKCTAG